MRCSIWISSLATIQLTACTIESDLPNQQEESTSDPILTNFTRNNFRIINGVWFWDDTVGSQCGRDRTWTYTPVPGASVRQAGICPQGYPWYEMQVF